MFITELDTGPKFSLYAVVINNVCLVQDYIDSLELKQQRQVFALFNLILEHGPPKDQQKFKNIGDKIYELKTRSGVRILCFCGGVVLRKTLILTHGFEKPGKIVLRREKEKAIDWLNAFSKSAEII